MILPNTMLSPTLTNVWSMSSVDISFIAITMASLLVITGLQSPQLTLIPSVWAQQVTQYQGTSQPSSLLQLSPLHLKHHSLLLSPFPNLMLWILGSLSQASHSLNCCNITHSCLHFQTSCYRHWAAYPSLLLYSWSTTNHCHLQSTQTSHLGLWGAQTYQHYDFKINSRKSC